MKNIIYSSLFVLLLSFSTGVVAQTSRLVATTGNDTGNCGTTPCLTINYAIGQAVAGDIIEVANGNYIENVNINKNITLRSTNGRDFTTITGISGVGAPGTIFIPNSFISNGIKIGSIGRGFKIIGIDNNNPAIENAAIYFQGNHINSELIGNEVVANGDHGLLTGYSTVNGFLIDSNIFSGKTFQGASPADIGFANQFATPNVPRQLVVMGCNNNCATTLNITFTNNQVIGTAGGTNGGGEQGNTLVTIDATNVTVRCNTFAGTTTRFGSSLRTRGPLVSQTIQNNTFSNANISASARPSMLILITAPVAAVAADYTAILALNRVDAAASVLSVTSPTANGTYATNSTVDVTVQFNSPVIIAGTPQLTLETGTIDRIANYLSGSGSCELTFRYTVQAGDETADLDYISTTALALNGGTITNSGTTTSLTLPAVGGAGSLGANKNIVIDGVRPSVMSIMRQNPTTTTSTANSVVYRVTFSKAVQNVDIADFALTSTGTAAGVVGSFLANSTTEYDITVNTITGAGTLRLDVPTTATINDLLGNALTAAFTTGQTYTFAVPTASIIQNPTTTVAISSISVVFRVIFDKAVQNVDIADFILSKTGTADGLIFSVSTNTGTSIDVTVNAITGAGTLRLDIPLINTINDNLANIATAFSAGEVYTIDRVAPTVVSVLRQNPLNVAVSVTKVTFAVTFSEDITGLDAADFVVTNSGTEGTISNITVNGNSALVEISSIRRIGTLRLDVLTTATINDLAGNAFVGGFTGGESYFIVLTPIIDVTVQAGSRQVTLSWSSVLFANSYEIYMYSANMPQTLVGTTDKTTFTVTGLENGVTYFFRIVVAGSTDFSTTVSARPSIVLSTEEETASTLFQVYPNPSNGSFTLKANAIKGGNATVSVLDMSGRIVFSQAIQASGSIETELNLNLSSGVYLLHISTEKDNLKRKLVIL